MKKHIFTNKKIVVFGATGGLGSGFAKALHDEGADLFLVGRREEKLIELSGQLGRNTVYGTADTGVVKTLHELANKISIWSSEIDMVVNASGYDVRKSLLDHTDEEVEKLINANLLGVINMTRLLLPLLKNTEGSSILHIGGFADGRIAYPYYSADVATRAGLYSFMESMNRELEHEGSKVRIKYFCPSPAMTKAEEPFHPLWKNMGIKIKPVEEVAAGVIKLLSSKKHIYIMGGTATVIVAKINSIMPRLADLIFAKSHGHMLIEFIYGKKKVEAKQAQSWLKKMAIIFIIASFILYALLPAVPFLPFSLGTKGVVTGAMLGTSEVIWWIGLSIVGKEVAQKYRSYLNPRNWCTPKETV